MCLARWCDLSKRSEALGEFSPAILTDSAVRALVDDNHPQTQSHQEGRKDAPTAFLIGRGIWGVRSRVL